MRRREFITALGGAVATTAWPLTALAQHPSGMRRIGVLSAVAADDPVARVRIAAFLLGLQQLGWTIFQLFRFDELGTPILQEHA